MSNSLRIGFELTNWKELRAMLQQLPPAMEERVMNAALARAAKPIVNAAKAKAPVRTGALRASITAVVRQYPKNNKTLAIIGPAKGYFRGAQKLKKKDDRRGADAPHKYAHLVEYGHYSGAASGVKFSASKGKKRRKGTFVDNSFVLPRPFLRPAVLSTQGAVQSNLVSGIGTGLKREIKRLGAMMKSVRGEKTTT